MSRVEKFSFGVILKHFEPFWAIFGHFCLWPSVTKKLSPPTVLVRLGWNFLCKTPKGRAKNCAYEIFLSSRFFEIRPILCFLGQFFDFSPLWKGCVRGPIHTLFTSLDLWATFETSSSSWLTIKILRNSLRQFCTFLPQPRPNHTHTRARTWAIMKPRPTGEAW